MSKMFQVYGIGQALIPVLPPPLPFENPPTSNQTNYEIGQLVFSPPKSPTAFFLYGGGGNWVEIATGTGAILSVTGTANQISAVTTAGNVVLSLIGPYTPATYTAHGVLIGEGTSSIVATAAGTAGQLLTSGGASADPTWTTATFPATAGATGTILKSNGTNWVASTDTFPDTVVAGALLLATATNVIGSLADVAVGQLLASGGVGVVPAYTASPSVTGNITAATGFVATAAGSGITFNAGTVSGTTTGTLNARVGQITITTPSIAAGATFAFTLSNSAITGSSTQVMYALTGGTTGAALTIQSYANTASQSVITLQNGTGATTNTASLTLNFIVLN